MSKTIENLKKLKSFHNGSWGADIDKAIKVLEQEPCEDAVSRANLLNTFEDRFIELQKAHKTDMQLGVNWCINTLKDMPPVTPQHTNVEIQKMQELEQVEIQKAYKLGKEDNFKVLDKIRAEIKVMTSNRGFLSCSVEYIHEEIDNVFDKYRPERG